MDARLHHLQGKAKRVKPSELVRLLQEFYRDKLGLKERHEAGARAIADYDFNNTYQYIIAREDVHLAWIRAALERLEAVVPTDGTEAGLPTPPDSNRRQRETLEDDSRRMHALVEKWRDRIEHVTNAREKGMLRVVIGEALEHKRFFDQALAGRSDLLGRRADGAGTSGSVLPTRWIE
jgi:hypothetical protein